MGRLGLLPVCRVCVYHGSRFRQQGDSMNLIDFSESRQIERCYGGGACGKSCIAGDDGAPWMLKRPARGRRQEPDSVPSPAAEWLGPHIYGSLGVPVHESKLGFRGGRLLCACRDFVYPDKAFESFHDCKNSLSDDLRGYQVRPSDGRSLYLSDILSAIEDLGDRYDSALLRERFWDMFVIDTFIGNSRRSNEDWGILCRCNRTWDYVGLAPVFDNGGASFGTCGSRDGNPEDGEEALEKAVPVLWSTYLADDGHRIDALSYMAGDCDAGCAAALMRFRDHLDRKRICDLVLSLPEDDHGITVMPEEAKKSCLEELGRRAGALLEVAFAKEKRRGIACTGGMDAAGKGRPDASAR